MKGTGMAEKTFGKKGTIITGVIIGLLIAVLGLNVLRAGRKEVQSEKKIEIVPVKTVPSQTMELDRTLELTGNIRPELEVEVSFKIPGQIIRDIFVDTGQYIQAGDRIAILEKDSIMAKMNQAGAALDLARANNSQAETNFEVLIKDKQRIQNLYRQKAISRQQLDHMEAQVKTAGETKKLAQAQIKQASATVRELEIAYNDHTLLAPISGYVSKKYVDRGSMSAPGAPVIRISKEDSLKIITQVTEKEFVQVQKGMPVEIRVDAIPDKSIQGSVSLVSPTINPESRTGEIEIHVDNKEKLLKAGMFARVALSLGKKQATVVSRDALLKIPGTGGYYVYVVEEGKAVQKNIEIGIEQEKIIEVIRGIKPGENVVVTGQNRIREGVPVTMESKKT